jgi:MinD-like ATPase involved in chromosome partitioning or flagellar assembly
VSDGALEVVLAVRGPDESRLVTALSAPGAGVRVVRRCADVEELVAVTGAGLGAAAVVSADHPGLTRDAVAALHDAGVRLLALVEVGAEWQRDRMLALGVDAVRTLDAEPADVVRALREGGVAVADEPHAGTSVPPRPGRQGRLVAVWGPHGAPGRTTVAVNVATELAARSPLPGAPAPPDVLLVDADTTTSSLAQHLAMLDESSGIALAARAAGLGRLDGLALAELAPLLDTHLRVLSGIGRPSRWPELTPVALDAVWAAARDIADLVVVDCAASIEEDEALTYDTRAPQRNGATLATLRAADLVVVVGGADPVSLTRLVRALGDLDAVGTRARRVVVVNRVRGARRSAASEVQEVLARHAGLTDPVLLPEDAMVDQALFAGRTLAEVAPHTNVRRALAGLAGQVRALAADETGSVAQPRVVH